MIDEVPAAWSRRGLLRSAAVVAGCAVMPGAVAKTLTPASSAGAAALKTTALEPRAAVAKRLGEASRVVRPELFREALKALESHGSRVRVRDRIAIADFNRASSSPRLHLVDLADGDTTTLLVAHGSGSDPGHTGYLSRFSNAFGSNASCAGAFVTSNYYVGKHGKSQRLVGLDPTNNNALGRAIVIHGAWYANRDMLTKHGKLGRSQGCFAVGEGDLERLFARLGEGRMIYAAKS